VTEVLNFFPRPTTGDKRVLIVILNWNSPDRTLAAVESVLKMEYTNYRVVVIDNGSVDDSIEVLSKIEDGRVKLIASPENLGYTGGCNYGFAVALENDADYVWLLNNDAVTEVNTLSSLVRVAEGEPQIGLVSPMIASLQRPSIFIYAGGFFNAQIPAIETTRDKEKATKWAAEHRDNIILLGTALLVKIDLIRKIGMLDPNLFAYWEDHDFSMRSNEAGFRNVVDLTAKVFHNEKFPTDRPQDIDPHFWYYLARNEIRFWKKHTGPISRMRPLWWAYHHQLNNLRLLDGGEPSKRAVLSGMWDGWLNRNGPYKADRQMPDSLARVIQMHSRAKHRPSINNRAL
jgi:GT2 family glycosyltransferase